MGKIRIVVVMVSPFPPEGRRKHARCGPRHERRKRPGAGTYLLTSSLTSAPPNPIPVSASLPVSSPSVPRPRAVLRMRTLSRLWVCLWGGPDVVGVYISDPDGATIELVEAIG